MTSNALDPSAILSNIPGLLQGDSNTLKAPQDGIAVLLHSVMTILGFRLVGVDDAASDSQFERNVLPEVWSKNSPDSFAFRYRHDQSSLIYLLKLVKLGKRLVIHGIALEDDKTTTLDIPVADFTSQASFPFVVEANSSSASPLVHCFISSARVTDLVDQFKLKILQKLVPGLRKEGYSEEPTLQEIPHRPAAGPSFTPQPQPPSANPSPLTDPSQPFALPRPGAGPRSPLEIGRSDLEPLGGAIPPPFGAFSPPPLFGGGDNGGGMYVGGNHPMFRDRMDPLSSGGVGGNRGPWGGDGFLPPMGAPPGARFDPVGPFGRGGPGNFPGVGNPLGGGGRNPRNFGPGGGGGAAGPDNDEFMPPGYSDMFS